MSIYYYIYLQAFSAVQWHLHGGADTYHGFSILKSFEAFHKKPYDMRQKYVKNHFGPGVVCAP